MATDVELGVESIDVMNQDRMTCVVRCLAGVVVPGQMLSSVITENGELVPVSVKIIRIWRFDHVVDILDPPHVARIELSGSLPGQEFGHQGGKGIRIRSA
jgi:hypothetical protein